MVICLVEMDAKALYSHFKCNLSRYIYIEVCYGNLNLLYSLGNRTCIHKSGCWKNAYYIWGRYFGKSEVVPIK